MFSHSDIFRRKLIPLLFSIGLLISALPVCAQNRSIAGKVTDEKGKPVANAQISIQQVEMNRNLKTKTDKKGEYRYFVGLQVARYRVVVRKEGYQPQYKENIQPAIGEEVEVDFQLVKGPDRKLPFEFTDAEREEALKQAAEAQKRRKFSAEVKAHFDQGVKLTDEGKYAEAIDEFNKALEKDPKQPGILARQAYAYTKLDKNEEALAAYQKAVDLSPNDPELLTNMGVVLNKLGKVAESQEAFKKAAAAGGGASAQSLYNLGVTMFNTQRVDEAIDAFKKAIAADPNFSEAYFQLGICLSGKPETIPEAVEAMKKYIEIGKKPDQVEVAKQLIAAMGGGK